MSRRSSTSSAAIDLGVARSTDFRGPIVSARVSPKWRAPRPVSWPPPLPEHRIPLSAPRSAPPNRFHEPVLHAPVVLPEPPRSKASAWPWVLLAVGVVAAAGAGFVLREPLSSGMSRASLGTRSVVADLAERPRIAWVHVEGFALDGVRLVRSYFGGWHNAAQAPEPPRPASALASPAPSPVLTAASAPAQAAAPARAVPAVPAVAFSALPVAPPPVAAAPAATPKPACRPRVSPPRAVAAQEETTDQSSDERAAPPPPPKAAPAARPSEAPASSPAPEPGSLDDLIRRAVENDKKKAH
jgi:hypothetical protein